MAAFYTPELAGVLDNRKWWRRTEPFLHYVAYDVLRPPYYDAAVLGFRDLTAEGRSGYLDSHDIYGRTLTSDSADALPLFTSRAWHDMLATLVGVEATGHVNCGVHHHLAGSADGFVHNDLNPGWFIGSPARDSVQLASPMHCDYKTGASAGASTETVRAIAALYYLDNEDWSAGDGGATGLYRSVSDPIGEPVARVAPINNSLLVFECSPVSFHGFMSNTRHPRNTVIMWLHRSKSDAVRRWGEGAIVAYAR